MAVGPPRPGGHYFLSNNALAGILIIWVDPYGGGVGEHVDNVQVGGEGDPPRLEFFGPVLVEHSPEVLVKRTGVGEEGGGQQHVAHQSEKGPEIIDLFYFISSICALQLTCQTQ